MKNEQETKKKYMKNKTKICKISFWLLFAVFIQIPEVFCQQINKDIQRCHVIKEHIDSTRVKFFLHTNTTNRKISDYFLNDTASVCMMWWKSGNACVIELVDDSLFLVNEKSKVGLKKDTLLGKIMALSRKKEAYRMECDKEFLIMDYNKGLTGCWIKIRGQIVFIFYSTQCDLLCLDEESRKILSSLFVINSMIP